METKVTAKRFYEVIGPMDVVLSIEGNYPYKTIFKLRHGGIIGWNDNLGSYYLVEQEN